MSIGLRVILVSVLLFVMNACSMATTALKMQGAYPSPGGMCIAELKTSPKGGYLQLVFKNRLGESFPAANDVTGFLWFDKSTLVFSTSPIYGKPGLFKITCSNEMPNVKVLVNPNNINADYPDGADYFELIGAKDNNLQYYYGYDVDNIDFNDFRTDKYMRSVVLPRESN